MRRTGIALLLITTLLNGCAADAAHGPLPSFAPSERPAYSDEEAFLSDCIDAYLFEEEKLPDRTPAGETITWSVLEGNARIDDGIIRKTSGALEYETICLQCETAESKMTFDSITLNDPKVADLITYFSSEGSDAEQLKLAYTYNGTYWFKVNHDSGILKPKTGTRRLRDPSLVRKPGGGFALLATQGYDTDSVYVYDTEDLVHYENERLLCLNASADHSMSGTQAWAPEAFYDPILNTYVIIWSSPNDGGVYYSTSDDLKNCSYPKRLCDPGFPIIDLTLTHTASGRTAILKDEREPMESYSQLLRANGPAWNMLKVDPSPLYDRHQLEGPMIIKSQEKPGWFICADDYTRSDYIVFYTEDIASGTLREYSGDDLLIPIEQPSHGYSLPVTWRELERIFAVYPDGS